VTFASPVVRLQDGTVVSDAVVCVPASGSRFQAGTTQVSCTVNAVDGICQCVNRFALPPTAAG
jgi:hypothetical protein